MRGFSRLGFMVEIYDGMLETVNSEIYPGYFPSMEDR
jgi:hypothetical protein